MQNPFQPPAASTIANSVDQLYYMLSGIPLFHRADLLDHFLLHAEVSPEVTE
jgi:hypothetical protein